MLEIVVPPMTWQRHLWQSQIAAFLLLSVAFSGSLASQSEGQKLIIDRIRSHYAWVNEGIDDAQRENVAEKGTFHSNRLAINHNKNAWPGVGQYQRVTTFWYDREPSIARLQDEPLAIGLLKVVVTSQVSAVKSYQEYLYEQGRLVFAFLRDEEGETRVYYSAQKPVRLINSEGTFDLADIEPGMIEVAARALDHALHYQRLFLASFGEYQ